MLQNCQPQSQRLQQRVGSVDGFPLFVAQPDLTDYVVGYDWPVGGRIAQLNVTCDVGNGQVSVLINGNAVTGIDHVPIASGTRSEHQATGDNIFTNGDDIALRVDLSNNIQNLKATIVTSNRQVSTGQLQLPTGFTVQQLAITPDLAGLDAIPITFPEPLRAIPIVIPGIFIKSASSDDNVAVLSVSDQTTEGFVYHLSAGAIEGQSLLYFYIIQ
jgi:hypothetical protein